MANKQIWDVTEDLNPNIQNSYVLIDKLKSGSTYETYKLQMSRFLSCYALQSDVPKSTSSLTNDSGFVTSSGIGSQFPTFIDYSTAPTFLTWTKHAEPATDPESQLENATQYDLTVGAGTKGYLCMNMQFFSNRGFGGRLYIHIGTSYYELDYMESSPSQYMDDSTSKTFDSAEQVFINFNTYVSGGEKFHIYLTNSSNPGSAVSLYSESISKTTLWSLK